MLNQKEFFFLCSLQKISSLRRKFLLIYLLTGKENFKKFPSSPLINEQYHYSVWDMEKTSIVIARDPPYLYSLLIVCGKS